MALLQQTATVVARCLGQSPVVAVLPWRGCVCLMSHQRHYVHRHHAYENRRYLSQKVDGNKDPVPFLASQARKFKVDDAYRVDPATRRKQRYAIPLGFGLFGVIMYFGFFRTYGEVDSSVMDFLTRDISSKLPEDARQRMPADVVEKQGPKAEPTRQN